MKVIDKIYDFKNGDKYVIETKPCLHCLGKSSTTRTSPATTFNNSETGVETLNKFCSTPPTTLEVLVIYKPLPICCTVLKFPVANISVLILPSIPSDVTVVLVSKDVGLGLINPKFA